MCTSRGGCLPVGAGIHITLRVAAEPYMRDLAEELGAMMMLLIAEGDEAVALSVVQPSLASDHLTFGLGGRLRLGVGSGGVAVPLGRVDGMPTACLSVITHREEIAMDAPPVLMEAAKRLSLELS